MNLAPVEKFLIQRAAQTILEGDEDLIQRASTFVAFVGVHRWGLDLERPAGRQEYSHLDDAIADTEQDLAEAGALPVHGDAVLEGARTVVDVLEQEGLDPHEPGGLAERRNPR